MKLMSAKLDQGFMNKSAGETKCLFHPEAYVVQMSDPECNYSLTINCVVSRNMRCNWTPHTTKEVKGKIKGVNVNLQIIKLNTT